MEARLTAMYSTVTVQVASCKRPVSQSPIDHSGRSMSRQLAPAGAGSAAAQRNGAADQAEAAANAPITEEEVRRERVRAGDRGQADRSPNGAGGRLPRAGSIFAHQQHSAVCIASLIGARSDQAEIRKPLG